MTAIIVLSLFFRIHGFAPVAAYSAVVAAAPRCAHGQNSRKRKDLRKACTYVRMLWILIFVKERNGRKILVVVFVYVRKLRFSFLHSWTLSLLWGNRGVEMNMV